MSSHKLWIRESGRYRGAVSRELFPRLCDDLRGLNSAGSPADGRMDAAPLSLAVTRS